MATAVIQQKNYWYYSNGCYELESIHNTDGTAQDLMRHITGPVPQNEIWNIVNNWTLAILKRT